MKKDTVYIDIEDDITAIIEKVNESKEKIVALVPPKRSTALSSVVNLKLIHKTAQDQNKRVVLITTDKTMVALAGGIGMYVAANLQSAPAIPAVSGPPEDIPSEVIRDDDPAPTPKRAVPAAVVPAAGGEVVDDLSKGDSRLKKALKTPKVPDFNRFKKKVFLIIFGGIGVVALFIWALYFAPHATITLAGQTSRIPTSVEFTADTSVEQSDFDKKVLVATSKEIKRDTTQDFDATGEKDLGKKASGTLSLTNCIDDGQRHTVPAGTKFSSGDLAFSTTQAVTLEPAVYSGNTCRTDLAATLGFRKSVAVRAVEAGDKYNLSARDYTSPISGISAAGTDMSGGTTDVVKVISKTDVAKAREALLKKLRENTQKELTDEFDDAIHVIGESYGEKLGTIKPSVGVGERADRATLSGDATYYLLGIDRATMEEFLRQQQQPSLQPNQSVFKTGLDDATLTRTKLKTPGRQVFNLKTDGYGGPDTNMDELRSDLTGKSYGDAKNRLQSIPGVTEANIDLSPFWVYSLPRRPGNITITINVDQSKPAEPQQ